MNKIAPLVWITCSLLLYTSLAHASEVKVGIIDLQKTIQNSNDGKRAKTELEAAFTKKKKELDDEGAALKKSQEDFQKKKGAMNAAVRKDQGQKLQEKIAKYQALLEKSSHEIQEKQQEMSEPILRRIRLKVAEIAKKKSLNLVLEKNDNVVLYSEENEDITNEVLSSIN